MEIVDVLAKMDEHLARQDEILAKMDERLARQDDTLRQMAVTLDGVNQSVERVAQHSVRLGQVLAEHTLLFDRCLQTLDRINARLDARG